MWSAAATDGFIFSVAGMQLGVGCAPHPQSSTDTTVIAPPTKPLMSQKIARSKTAVKIHKAS
jgi:hypothetical protein